MASNGSGDAPRRGSGIEARIDASWRHSVMRKQEM